MARFIGKSVAGKARLEKEAERGRLETLKASLKPDGALRVMRQNVPVSARRA